MESGVSEDISPSQRALGSIYGDRTENAESDSSRNADSESNNKDSDVLVPESVSSPYSLTLKTDVGVILLSLDIATFARYRR